MKKLTEKQKKAIAKVNALMDLVPEKAHQARKVYSAMDLVSLLQNLYYADPECTSGPKLIERLKDVGKRLNYMKYEFTDEEITEMFNYAKKYIIEYHSPCSSYIDKGIRSLEGSFEEAEHYGKISYYSRIDHTFSPYGNEEQKRYELIQQLQTLDLEKLNKVESYMEKLRGQK